MPPFSEPTDPELETMGVFCAATGYRPDEFRALTLAERDAIARGFKQLHKRR